MRVVVMAPSGAATRAVSGEWEEKRGQARSTQARPRDRLSGGVAWRRDSNARSGHWRLLPSGVVVLMAGNLGRM